LNELFYSYIKGVMWVFNKLLWHRA